MSLDRSPAAMRNVTTWTPLATARSTSRSTCSDTFAFGENSSTITRESSIPSMMADPHVIPGRMSRGAIQQRTRLDSRAAQAASATTLSLLE